MALPPQMGTMPPLDNGQQGAATSQQLGGEEGGAPPPPAANATAAAPMMPDDKQAQAPAAPSLNPQAQAPTQAPAQPAQQAPAPAPAQVSAQAQRPPMIHHPGHHPMQPGQPMAGHHPVHPMHPGMMMGMPAMPHAQPAPGSIPPPPSQQQQMQAQAQAQVQAQGQQHPQAQLPPPHAQPQVQQPQAQPHAVTDMKRIKEETPLTAEDSQSPTKKQRTENPQQQPGKNAESSAAAPAPVLPSRKGISYFSDNDVLSGRGGGTNVHPGNRNFRDLINLHRRAYLKARKNDKPAISRAIVRAIRENNGRFLKKDEKSGLWFEIGDDAAREKTSQALRQRAPEMRKLLFDTEREEARVAAEEHLRQQRMLMGMGAGADLMNQGLSPVVPPPTAAGMGGAAMGGASNNPMLNPALFAMANKNALANMQNIPSDPYTQMFSAALLGGGINRYSSTEVAPSGGK